MAFPPMLALGCPCRWSNASLPCSISAVIANWLIKKERADSESRLKSATSDLADAVDQEIESTMRTMRSIATLDNLKSGDLRTFHAQLNAIQKSQPTWVTIRLHSRDRKLLLSSVHPYGEALMPVVESESLVRLFTRKSYSRGYPAHCARSKFSGPSRFRSAHSCLFQGSG
jgi:hypothetical protein